MRALATALTSILAATYPLAVWWGLTHGSARSVGLLLLAIVFPLLLLRLWPKEGGMAALDWTVLRVPLLLLALLTAGAVFDDPRFVLVIPVLINTALLLTFGATLRRGDRPMIERFARLVEPELSPDKAAHCRQATVAWCVFFVANGSVALALAAFGDHAAWALYNGGITYALMALMFAGELLVRRFRFRDYGAGPLDRLLRVLWPPPGPRETSTAVKSRGASS